MGRRGFLLVIGIVASTTSLFACTGFYVGKRCSADGSTLIGRTVDLGLMGAGHRIVAVPRAEGRPGRVYRGAYGFTWPLPETTWRYVHTPRLSWEGDGDFSSVGANEKGVTITATVTGYVRPEISKAFPAVPTGCAEENITPVVAASCASAADAVELIGRIVEKCGTREPNVIMVADRKEAWIVETYTGRLWAAMRLPDDKVSAFGNNFLLTDYDSASPDWKAAPDIAAAPQAKGLAVFAKDGKLDLFHTYSGKRYQYANLRSWFAKRLFAPGTEGPYADGAEFPLVYVPTRKLCARDIFEAMRYRYEGTEWCPDETGRKDVRVIGTESQSSSHVISLRDDLPAERCVTIWICLGPAEHSVYLPVSNAIEGADPDYVRDWTGKRRGFRPGLACDAFRRLAVLCQTDRKLCGQGVREFWAARERELLDRWPEVCLRGDAAEMTAFSRREQRRALDDALRMHDELEWNMAANGQTRRYNHSFGVLTPMPEKKPYRPLGAEAASAARGAADCASGVHDVRAYGAKGDGVTCDTAAIQAAIDAANAAGGGEVRVPAGHYVSGTIYLRSNVDFNLGTGALIEASKNPADYNAWDFCPQNSRSVAEKHEGGHLFVCLEQTNVVLRGGGTIDGNGRHFMTHGFDKRRVGASGTNGLGGRNAQDAILWRPAQMLWFCESRDIRLDGVRLVNAPYWSVLLHGCSLVRVDGVVIRTSRENPRVYNGDGLNIDCCRHVRVSNCDIETSDDSLCLRANGKRLLHAPEETAFVTVDNCTLSSLEEAFRIGVGDGPIHDCTFANCVIRDSKRGINFSSTWFPSRGCDFENIRFDNIVSHTRSSFLRIHRLRSSEPVVRGLHFSDISGTQGEDSYIWSRKGKPFEDITLSNVSMNRGIEVVNVNGFRLEGGTLKRIELSPEEYEQRSADIETYRKMLY